MVEALKTGAAEVGLSPSLPVSGADLTEHLETSVPPIRRQLETILHAAVADCPDGSFFLDRLTELVEELDDEVELAQ